MNLFLFNLVFSFTDQIYQIFSLRSKKHVIPIVKSLCQDVDYEVRGRMCANLPPIIKSLK